LQPPPPAGTGPATLAQPPTLRRPDEVQPQTQTTLGEPATQPVKFPELTSPPAPPTGAKPETTAEVKSETKPQVEIGWTRDQVEAALGEPGKKVKDRGQEIYLYEHVKVVFEHGKVVGSSK
jgi:hypothetical protein